PRNLKDPVRCSVSHFRNTRPPVTASSTGEVISGVCKATPLSRCAAASTSAAVGKPGSRSRVVMATVSAWGRLRHYGLPPLLKTFSIIARVTPSRDEEKRQMDLGIAGRKAIVCASSRGLGRACALALAQAGCEVTINGRDRAQLDATAAEIGKATGAKVQGVLADVATAEGQAALFAACPEPDILVPNNAGPPFR